VRPARALAALVLLFAAPFAADAEAPPVAPKPDAPACVKHRAEARYRNLAYDHLVHVRNACGERVVCRISTNVYPLPVELSLTPGEGREVLTWRGSPAREFTALVACQFVRGRR
jgi:hypothetical protein